MGLEYKTTGVLHLGAIGVIIFYLLTASFPKSYAVGAVLFFIIKGIAFTIMKQNPLSALDTIAGIYLMFPVFNIFSNIILNIIAIGFLVQKGIIYLFR
ncbi:MAG: hypothetical protein QXO57_02965 [Candidatus Aenigmatarchaeota archaeon]|nr:hypothetical protein [Candidatus Aenigmarchaeota archaeon]